MLHRALLRARTRGVACFSSFARVRQLYPKRKLAGVVPSRTSEPADDAADDDKRELATLHFFHDQPAKDSTSDLLEAAQRRFDPRRIWRRGRELAEHPKRLRSLLHKNLVAPFLPRNFPESVTPNYLPYVQWYAAQATLSAACGVLATQSLLIAVGLGASTALPAAAVINWVLKDGLGQLGGVLFAHKLNNRFDSDPRKYRLVSALALDAATCLEILTPCFPALFLPMASVANAGKNIAWLTASATRASIHRSLMQSENMADITAKSGSQSIAASIAGTGLGLGVSMLLGGSPDDFYKVLAGFAVLSSGHLYCNYRALREVVVATLNPQRAEILMSDYIDSNTVPTPHQVGRQERFVPVLSSLRELAIMSYQSRFKPSSHLQVGSRLDAVAASRGEFARLLDIFHDERYLLQVSPTSSKPKSSHLTVHLVIEDGASSEDVIAAYLHAMLVRTRIAQLSEQGADLRNADTRDDLLRTTLDWSRSHRGDLLAKLDAAGWVTAHHFVEETRARYTVE